MKRVAVTDTHALIWYACGLHRKLRRAALRLFQRADAGTGTVHVPTIVLVEVAELAAVGRIVLGRPFREWEGALFGSGNFVAADLTREVVRAAEQLPSIPERSDRLIAATALALECPLITRDPAIAAAASVEVIW